jgi:peptide-methionine (S)-S-oxide reductase
MRYALYIALIALVLGWFVMQLHTPARAADETPAKLITPKPNEKQASFSAGCFWGVEESFRRLKGVTATQVGYAGGHTDNPTYQDVCTDQTGYAETCLVTYDPKQISYAELLDAFWTMHDPTTKDAQGPDHGTQYRSIIFFHDDDQKKIAEASLKEVQDSKVFSGKIVTEILPAPKFYTAEEYHQKYFFKLGNGETCQNGITTVHTTLAATAAKDREASAQK